MRSGPSPACQARASTCRENGEATGCAFDAFLEIDDIVGGSTSGQLSTRDLSQTALAPMAGSPLQIKWG